GAAASSDRPVEDAMTELDPKARAFFEATRALDEPSDADRQRVRAATLAKIAAIGAATGAATAAKAAAAASPALAPAAGIGTGWLGGALAGGLLALGVLGADTAVEITTGRSFLAPAAQTTHSQSAMPSEAFGSKEPHSVAPSIEVAAPPATPEPVIAPPLA